MKKIFVLCVFMIAFAGAAYADMQITITAAGRTLNATLEENSASRSLYERLPLVLKMKDLYSREMCYFLPYTLPTGKLTAGNYEVGDIIYWPPQRCLVILYKQNGERFQRQHLGHIDGDVKFFETTGDTEVIFDIPHEKITIY